jgi:hydroxylaminobenzene mutase
MTGSRKTTAVMRTADCRLMWHGMFLFLFGLVTGQQERRFTNKRMALSAHLQGVLNGTFLIALGAIWDHVVLPPPAEKIARLSALYGTYGNWLFTTLGAAMGTAAANPILSQGHHGKPWQERVAAAGFRSIAYSILVAVVLILWGLGARRTVPATAVNKRDGDRSIASPNSSLTIVNHRLSGRTSRGRPKPRE